jgi:hypothetical protein
MRRFVSLVLVLVMVPASVAWGAELDELLERSSQASYSAEQIISCSTPDGVRDAVVRLAQADGEIRVGSAVTEEVEVFSGDGDWTLSRGDGVVTSATVTEAEAFEAPAYEVEEAGGRLLLGRRATAYRLFRDGVLRAELVFDDAMGAMVMATTYAADGSVYCQRRFVSLDPTPPVFPAAKEDLDPGAEIQSVDHVSTNLPDIVAGFQRLDLYEDEDGFRFAYYSDGFFSFAVFETPTRVMLPDGVVAEIGGEVYERSFTAGQATYVWESRVGGMALVGDLPPDMHESVLAALPRPEEPGLFRRLWRRLFG